MSDMVALLPMKRPHCVGPYLKADKTLSTVGSGTVLIISLLSALDSQIIAAIRSNFLSVSPHVKKSHARAKARRRTFSVVSGKSAGLNIKSRTN